MNVFHRYTRQALRENRSRTWVTIVGIILSVALFTAVTEGCLQRRAVSHRGRRVHRRPVPRSRYQNLTEQQATQPEP